MQKKPTVTLILFIFEAKTSRKIFKMINTANLTSCQPLLDYFGKLIPLKREEKELVEAKFHPHTFAKKQFVLQQGKICDHFDFVVKGCLRLFKVDEKGDYHVFQFATENYWILDLTSFHKRIPSTLNIEALEDTLVLRITHRDLLDLYIKAPKFDRIFRVLLENHFMQQQERIGQLFSSTAEERYLSFLEQYPHLFNRIPNTQIASYLGITPEFLSKIRKNLQSKG